MSLSCEPTTFRDRAAMRLNSETFEVIALRGCGHVASLRLAGVDVNPLWEPPWPSLEPDDYNPDQHDAHYGLMEGKLLASIAGHSLCLNHFGGLSASETQARGYFHGEASNLNWNVSQQSAHQEEASFVYGLELPEARLRFERRLSIRPGEATLYFKERFTNPQRIDTPLICQQHVTLGPPFVEPGVTRVDLPAARGRTHPVPVGDADPLQPDTDYHWPHAPLRDGGTSDASLFSGRAPCSSLVSVLLECQDNFAFMAASNAKLGLALVYIFPHDVFPWTALWTENHAGQEVPWNGRAMAWGVEWGTTPFPLELMQILTAGPLFGRDRMGSLGARQTLEVNYQAQLLTIPSDWRGVARIEHRDGETILHEKDSERTVGAPSGWQVSAERAGIATV